jgi:NTP pyrophosphatase (non-canonical NTP hydrolase)
MSAPTHGGSVDYNKYLHHVMSHAKPLDYETDLHHMCLGLVSEVGELHDALKAHMIYGKPIDVVNIGEEAGDALWFAGGFASLLKLDFHELVVSAASLANPRTDKKRVLTYAAWAIDAAAACHIEVAAFVDEKQPMRLPRMASEIIRYVKNVGRIAEVYGLDLERSARCNMAKLDFRYGGREFSAEKGLNRDKAAEHRVIEAALGLELAG